VGGNRAFSGDFGSGFTVRQPNPPRRHDKSKTGRALDAGAFHFLSTDVRKPNKTPLSLNIPAALTGENPKMWGCSKSEMPPLDAVTSTG
jgi:hypothetical protein